MIYTIEELKARRRCANKKYNDKRKATGVAKLNQAKFNPIHNLKNNPKNNTKYRALRTASGQKRLDNAVSNGRRAKRLDAKHREFLAAYFARLDPAVRPSIATQQESWDIVTDIMQTPREQFNGNTIAELCEDDGSKLPASYVGQTGGAYPEPRTTSSSMPSWTRASALTRSSR